MKSYSDLLLIAFVFHYFIVGTYFGIFIIKNVLWGTGKFSTIVKIALILKDYSWSGEKNKVFMLKVSLSS